MTVYTVELTVRDILEAAVRKAGLEDSTRVDGNSIDIDSSTHADIDDVMLRCYLEVEP